MSTSDLLHSAVESALLDLATQQATGCLVVTSTDGDEAQVWLRDGAVYSVSVPGRRALLGARLLSAGQLAPEALAEALEIQRTELQGWRLGELLVHLGYVERGVVEQFGADQLREMMVDLVRWPVATTKFRNGKLTRQDVAPPTEVADLIVQLRERRRRWEVAAAAVGGADAVPSLSAGEAAGDVALGPHDWALLCKVDGERTITDLADDCGFTLLEAAEAIASLQAAGLVDVDHGPATIDVSESRGSDPTDAEVAASVATVAAALQDMFAPPVEDSWAVAADEARRAAPRPAEDAAGLAAEAVEAAAAADDARHDTHGRAKAEAEAEARRNEQVARHAAEVQARLADAHRAAQETTAAHRAEEAAARAAAEAAERAAALEAEQAAARHAAAAAERQAAAEKLLGDEIEGWLEHATRLQQERAAAEAAAWADHAGWLDAQRRAAEIEAWDAHALWLERARVAAADAAWDEHEARRATEARLAAEAEAARLAEEARLAAEAEAARLLEEARLAAEAEAARVLAEAHAAAEADAARVLEAAHAAAEAEAAAARAEAARVADAARELEQARLAAEVEAAEAQRAQADADAAAAAQAVDTPVYDSRAGSRALSELGREAGEVAAAEVAAGPSPAEASTPTPVPDVTPTGLEHAHAEAPHERHERARDTDMAALMRELTSLAGPDEPATAPSTPPPARPPAPARTAPGQKAPKKRGLFGR